MQNLRNRCQAVRGARCVRDDRFTVVLVVVHAVNEHRRVVLRRSRHDDLLRACIDVLLRRSLVQKQTRRFDDNIRTDFIPLQVRRIAFLGQTDLLAIYNQIVTVHRHIGVKFAVHRVILQHVSQVIRFQQVVDAHYLNVVAEILDRRAEHIAANAAKTVNTNLNRHYASPKWAS